MATAVYTKTVIGRNSEGRYETVYDFKNTPVIFYENTILDGHNYTSPFHTLHFDGDFSLLPRRAHQRGIVGVGSANPIEVTTSSDGLWLTWEGEFYSLQIKKEWIDQWSQNNPGDWICWIGLDIPIDSFYKIAFHMPHKMPTVNHSFHETNAILNGASWWVTPLSIKDVQLSASFQHHKITNVAVSYGNVVTKHEQTASNDLIRTLRIDTSKVTEFHQGLQVYIDITDDGGRTSRKEVAVSSYRYIPPEILEFKVERGVEVGTELYVKSLVRYSVIPSYTPLIEFSVNDSPYEPWDKLTTENGFLTSLPLEQAFDIKLRLTDNYGFMKLYEDIAVTIDDMVKIFQDKVEFETQTVFNNEAVFNEIPVFNTEAYFKKGFVSLHVSREYVVGERVFWTDGHIYENIRRSTTAPPNTSVWRRIT